MTASWLLLVAISRSIRIIAAIGVPHGQCDHQEDQNIKVEDSRFSDALFGFKPCVDENCGDYSPVPETTNDEASYELDSSDESYKPHVPQSDAEYPEERPKVYCIKLVPTAIQTFREIEHMHPGISTLKYRVLEELIDHMYAFATLELDNCDAAMKLVDLVILAGNSLKTQYVLQGGNNCTYRKSEHVPNEDVIEEPFEQISPEYPSGATWSGSTMKPIVDEPTSQKPAEPVYENPVSEKPVYERCPDSVTAEQPCHSKKDTVTEEHMTGDEVEIIAEAEEFEHKYPIVGSLRGIPGVHYPNYTEIPITSFTCADKKCIPGFYADLDTGCQVFHVCYEHRRESFLCPIGTTFNQPILACDYWYSSNCSLAPHYYDVNEKTEFKEEKIDMEVEELLMSIAESEKSAEHHGKQADVQSDMDKIAQFFPVKIVVTETKPEVPETKVSEVDQVAAEIVDKMATTATKVISSTREVIKSIPAPVEPEVLPVFKKKPLKMEKLLAKSVVPLAKAKLAAIPVSKVTGLKTAVPLAAKAKVAVPVFAAKAKLATKAAAIPVMKAAVAKPFIAKAAGIPIMKAAVAKPFIAKAAAIPVAKVVATPFLAKAKVASKAAVAAPVIAKAAAVPVFAKAASVVPKIAVKSAIPALKAKKIASAVPLAKTKIVPVVKAKVAKSTPFLKAKMLSLPLAKGKVAASVPFAKVKLAKAAAISPLTKKALTLGYMKLLKAKKIALMG